MHDGGWEPAREGSGHMCSHAATPETALGVVVFGQQEPRSALGAGSWELGVLPLQEALGVFFCFDWIYFSPCIKLSLNLESA